METQNSRAGFYSMTRTIPAGGVSMFDVNATFVRVKEAEYSIALGIDDALPEEFELGLAYISPVKFRRVTVRNTSAYPNKVTLQFAADGGVIADDRLNLITGRGVLEVVDPKTRVAGWTGDLAANSGHTFAPALQPGDIRRKAVVVSNGDATSLRIQMRDPSGIAWNIILPGETAVFPISETVEVFNPNPAPVSVYVGEIYWQK